MNDDVDTPLGDLTRLVQHVALNQSDWWDHATERLALACAFFSESGARAEIENLICESCGVQPNNERVSATLDRLLDAGDLVELEGRLRVSEEQRKLHVERRRDTLDSEQRVRERFNSLSSKYGLESESDELWTVIETEVVMPAVRHMGARLYSLLTAAGEGGNNEFEHHMQEFSSRRGESVRSFFADVLDPGDEDVRAFVLRRLNAQYAIDAAALPIEALQRLSSLGRKAQRVDVFLDTNVLFSILELGEHPGNDVASDLLDIVSELRGRVDIRLYVLPDTVEEARRVLREVILRLDGFRGQRNLAQAAQKTTSLGLASSYMAAASLAPNALTANDFFGPYESDLVRIMRNKSLELYNTDLSQLHIDQRVIDDIHDQTEYQEEHRERGPKTYEANLHDMVLWHFANSRRNAIVESPLEVSAWVVTHDYGLIRFDRHKRRGRSVPPVCLEPSSLIQLLQFWVPSSTQLDEALVGSVRQPLLFLPFDSESEQVTLRILNQLSRFEGAGDLDVEVASEILTSAALRNRLESSTADAEEDQELIQSGLAEMVEQLREEVTELQHAHQAEAAAVEREDTERRQREDAERRLTLESERVAHLERRNQILDEFSKGLRAEVDEVESINLELSEQLDASDLARRRQSERLRLAFFGAVACVLGSGILVAVGITSAGLFRGPFSWLLGASIAGLIIATGLEQGAKGTRYESLPFISHVTRVRRWWWAFIVAAVASAIGGIAV